MSVKITDLQIPPQGVLVVWEWEWTCIDEESNQQSEIEDEYCEEQRNPYLHSDTETADSDVGVPENLPAVTHTVTFKCVGSVHDFKKQLVLSKISRLLMEKKAVEVRIRPEPNNQFDAKAICFECLIDQKWEIIGYIVRECLDEVHKALKERSVKIPWAKYLVCSSTGFYTGINVTRSGEWYQVVVRSQST